MNANVNSVNSKIIIKINYSSPNTNYSVQTYKAI